MCAEDARLVTATFSWTDHVHICASHPCWLQACRQPQPLEEAAEAPGEDPSPSLRGSQPHAPKGDTWNPRLPSRAAFVAATAGGHARTGHICGKDGHPSADEWMEPHSFVCRFRSSRAVARRVLANTCRARPASPMQATPNS